MPKGRKSRGKKAENAAPNSDGSPGRVADKATSSALNPSMARSTSLSDIQATPRTPTRSRVTHNDSTDSVEMTLLGQRGALDSIERDALSPDSKRKPMSQKDKSSMVLLCVLYLIQGVPLGLALGSIPFLLKDHLSYSQLGTFALSGYPYSLKLLWSPIVDSVFIPSVGRRKSWIIPMQVIVGTVMLYISYNVKTLMDDPSNHINELTFLFTTLVFISATQDIAVDGWALTLLSVDNLSYASTCQTIGLNTGYFASFTVFLALNSVEFCNKWGIPQLTLETYLKFWAVICFAVSAWLLVFKKEDKEHLTDADLSVTGIYKTIWDICKLPHIRQLVIVHFFAKIGFAANDAATSLKFVEKGLAREDLALAVLIDFPFQILGGWLAARWSRGDKPLRPWLVAFWPRLSFCLLAFFIVRWFPVPPISQSFFVFIIVYTVLSSFSSTVQFVGISAFHTRVSDPIIGGTYMTLLNTFTNLGGTWPKYFVFKGIDMFTIATCHIPAGLGSETIVEATECASDYGKSVCADLGGKCVTESDGFYTVSLFCMITGAAFVLLYIYPVARRLQDLPLTAWRINP